MRGRLRPKRDAASGYRRFSGDILERAVIQEPSAEDEMRKSLDSRALPFRVADSNVKGQMIDNDVPDETQHQNADDIQPAQPRPE